jgi:hypothetical protein
LPLTGRSDITLKKIYPSIIPAKFGLIWFSSFREEDLNVTVYGLRQTPSEGKALMVNGRSVIKINHLVPIH